MKAELKAERCVPSPRSPRDRSRLPAPLALALTETPPRAPSLPSPRSLSSLAQKMAEDLEEAGNELIITDEESVRFSVGETFVLVENDDAETMLEAHLAEVSKEVADLESEKKELAAAMAELKEKLYKKFGNAINLEE